jgi:hypothetical protein
MLDCCECRALTPPNHLLYFVGSLLNQIELIVEKKVVEPTKVTVADDGNSLDIVMPKVELEEGVCSGGSDNGLIPMAIRVYGTGDSSKVRCWF